MVTSFAAGGLVALVPALAVMLGANIGTALIVKAFTFDVSWASPILLTLGYIAFKRGGREGAKHAPGRDHEGSDGWTNEAARLKQRGIKRNSGPDKRLGDRVRHDRMACGSPEGAHDPGKHRQSEQEFDLQPIDVHHTCQRGGMGKLQPLRGQQNFMWR